MPQIYTSRGNQVINRGASSMQQNAFMDQTAAARERKQRSDAALNKAVQALQVMKAPLGSEITNNDGVVNSNNILQDSMKPKTVDKSKGSRADLRMERVKSAAEKTLTGMNTFNALQGDRTAFDDVKEQARQAALGKVKATMGGLGGGGGNNGGGSGFGSSSSSGSQSHSVNSSLSKSMSLGERSLNNASDDYKLTGNFQQGFDDTFKRDSEGAWKQALMNDIIGTASGQGYDPAKDVYLQQANQRDNQFNQSLINEMTTNAQLTKFDRGSEMNIGGGNESASLSKGEGETKSGSFSESTNSGGLDEQEYNNPIASYDYTDPATGKRTQQTIRGRLEDGSNIVFSATQFGTNTTIDEDNLNGIVSVLGLQQDKGNWSWLPEMLGGGIDQINNYEDFKNNEKLFDQARNRPTEKGLNTIGYGALRQLTDNDPKLTKQLIENGKVVTDLSNNSVTLSLPDSGRNNTPEVSIRVYLGTDGVPKFKPLGDISMQLSQRLKGSLKAGDKNVRTDIIEK